MTLRQLAKGHLWQGEWWIEMSYGKSRSRSYLLVPVFSVENFIWWATIIFMVGALLHVLSGIR